MIFTGQDIPDGARFTAQHLSGVAASSAGVPEDMSNWTSGDLSRIAGDFYGLKKRWLPRHLAQIF